MKEKQFDHIENKIRAAAENSVPDFDEQGWQKMELLLDKDKDRKRPLGWFLLPLFLCMLTGGYFIFNNRTLQPDHGEKNIIPAVENNLTSSNNTNSTHVVLKNDPLLPAKNTLDNSPIVVPGKNPAAVFIASNAVNKGISATQYYSGDRVNSIKKKKLSDKSRAAISILSPDATEEDPADAPQHDDVVNPLLPSTTITREKKSTSTVKKDSLEKKNNSPDNNSPDKNLRKSSRFYFLALLGAEASSVKLLSLNNSAIVAKYGIGAGFQINKKWSIQAGFNVSRKKYIAGTGDYKPKEGSYWADVEIKKVDANCLVYEIPLAVRYNITQKKNTTIYATAGVSSFIMKKEYYDYDYIRYNTAYQSSWTYTGNKNLFSIATLSAGVEKKLNSRFSLLAEPSVSIPLTGVGDGSVKLFSVGLNAGLKYQPLKKKK